MSGASLFRNGYVDRLSDGRDFAIVNTRTVRVQLRWTPAANVEVNLLVDGIRNRNNEPALIRKGVDLRGVI